MATALALCAILHSAWTESQFTIHNAFVIILAVVVAIMLGLDDAERLGVICSALLSAMCSDGTLQTLLSRLNAPAWLRGLADNLETLRDQKVHATEAELMGRSKTELQALCEQSGLNSRGTKSQLTARLLVVE